MSTEPREDRLLEAALAITDTGTADWELLRRELPDEARTVAGLEALAGIGAVHVSEEPAAEAHGDELVRFRWGHLEAHRLLGEGSFGQVWAAWDPGLRREVALKLWRDGPVGETRLWLQEARRLARVRHPNVVTVHGADLHEGRAGLWMDRIRGRTLEELLALLGPFSAREATAVGIELCGALAAVHAAGMVHGDLKTRNVMREGSPGHPAGAGRVVLMDFGSAREHATGSSDAGSRGTPLFTAPEVLKGGKATPAADLYALGVVIYRLVTTRYPVEAQDLAELRARLDRGEATPLRALRPDLPAAFVSAVERALTHEPSRRFADAAGFERSLLVGLGGERGAEAVLRGAHAHRMRSLALVGIALLLGALGLWLARPHLERASVALRAKPMWVSQGVIRDMSGTATNGEFGNRLANVGDVNGDGAPELLVGAPAEGAGGRAYLFSLLPGAADHPALILEGEVPGERFGHTVTAAGDLNGDGHRDFAVAANLSDAGGNDAGRVYVYYGGPECDGVPDLILTGSHPVQDLGFALGTGDVNADGFDDLLAGAPTDNQAGSTTGRAYVWFGGPTMDEHPDLELASSIAYAQFGIAVEGIGDFNADGHDDFAVGANWDHSDGRFAGRAYVYFGGPRLDGRADLVLRGHRSGEFFGMIGRGGDVNGDGYTDLVVGADAGDGFERRSGAVYVYFGGPGADAIADVRLRGERRGDHFGFHADASGDFDRDGAADVVVGALFHDTQHEGAGRVYVFQGGRRMDDVPELVLDGPMQWAQFGIHCAPVGDLTGDGLVDLAVGAPLDSRRTLGAGSVQIFDLARWHVVEPRPGHAWLRGARARLEWTGVTPADVSWSLDGGRTWQPIARRAGGRANNTLNLAVPPQAEGVIRVRLVASVAPERGAVEVEVPVRVR